MQQVRVIGTATATIKHPSLNGWRMLVIQPLLADGSADGEPQIAIDHLGTAVGSLAIAAADGSAAREIMKLKDTPARWVIIGQQDASASGQTTGLHPRQ
jgi:ethanolamine utilization protein EutN